MSRSFFLMTSNSIGQEMLKFLLRKNPEFLSRDLYRILNMCHEYILKNIIKIDIFKVKEKKRQNCTSIRLENVHDSKFHILVHFYNFGTFLYPFSSKTNKIVSVDFADRSIHPALRYDSLNCWPFKEEVPKQLASFDQFVSYLRFADLFRKYDRYRHWKLWPFEGEVPEVVGRYVSSSQQILR